MRKRVTDRQLCHQKDWLAAFQILIFSALIVCVLYPGWLFYDSATQWDFAKRIVDNGFPLKLSDLYINSQWPVFLTLVKVPFLILSGEVGFYIFCQSVAMFSSIWLFLKVCVSRHLSQRALLLCFWIILITPFIWGYAIFHSSDTIAAIAALTMLSVLASDRLSGWSLILFFACGVILILSRFNAAPGALFLICSLCFIHRTELLRLKRLTVVGGILSLFFMGGVTWYQRTAYPVDIVMDGMLLRVWDVSRRVDDPELNSGLNALAIKPIDTDLQPSCFKYGTFCEQMRQTFDLAHLPYDPVKALYIRTALTHPIAFIQTSAGFGYHQVGISAPLAEDEVGWNKNYQIAFEQLNQRFDWPKEIARNLIHSSEQFPWGVPARPIVMALLSLLAAAFLSTRLVWLCAGFYLCWYAPLLAVAPAFGFRYAFPLTLVAYILICGSGAVLISKCLLSVRGNMNMRFRIRS
jgi:hypothetical protein